LNSRKFLLRGLAVLLPPLLTIVIFVWIWNTVDGYVLEPINAGVRNLTAHLLLDAREASELYESRQVSRQPLPALDGVGTEYRITRELADELAKDLAEREADTEDWKRRIETSQQVYVPVTKGSHGAYIPLQVYRSVQQNAPRMAEMPTTPLGYYKEYVRYEVLSARVVSVGALVALFIGVYFLGRFLALGLGRALWQVFEAMVFRLPLVRNVYSSVKQVTDFMLTERDEVSYHRVVAVEYPRKGIWSLGLVTGESMRQIHQAAGEEVIAVLVPSSPMPVTGYTINVLRSEVVDLDMSIDQAFQFCISCGVVVPPQQLPRPAREPIRRTALEATVAAPAVAAEVDRDDR
jgi:uncharacterized membrane protein